MIGESVKTWHSWYGDSINPCHWFFFLFSPSFSCLCLHGIDDYAAADRLLYPCVRALYLVCKIRALLLHLAACCGTFLWMEHFRRIRDVAGVQWFW